jgi:hypothetical protein
MVPAAVSISQPRMVLRVLQAPSPVASFDDEMVALRQGLSSGTG